MIQLKGLIGNFDWVFLKGVPSDAPLEQYAPTIPGVLFVKFQLMFAAITPLLLTGTIAERMKFSSFIIFIAAWSMLIYYPLVHWVWGGGWLADLGVVDFGWWYCNSYKCWNGSPCCRTSTW